MEPTEMTGHAPLQFGRPEPGVVYRDRPAAFGVASRDGRIALVEVIKPGLDPWFDLPGGALDPGESEQAALAREFGEETGLVVHVGPLITRADQFFRKTDGDPVNNRGAIFRVAVTGENPVLKIEADHTLVWLEPFEAMRRLRHDSHAWGVLCWIRSGAA
jgi:8-oxo-dGTP diphosphatase